ncbi:GTP-binding protein Rho1, partial [Serendipita sp. 401]
MPPKRKRPTIKGSKTSQKSDDRPRKLLTVGSSSSGKTCLLIRYFMDRYPTGYIPHVMDNTRVNIPVFSRVVTLDLWDTPVLSLSYSDKLRPLIYVGTSVFLMCFGIDNPNSLSSLEEVWVPEVKRYTRDTKPPILLVGCKMDVRTDSVELEKMRRNGGMEPVSVQQ